MFKKIEISTYIKKNFIVEARLKKNDNKQHQNVCYNKFYKRVSAQNENAG